MGVSGPSLLVESTDSILWLLIYVSCMTYLHVYIFMHSFCGGNNPSCLDESACSALPDTLQYLPELQHIK